MKLCVSWLALALAIACGRPAPPPQRAPAPVAVVADAAVVDTAPLDEDLPRLVARAITMYQDIAKALAASRPNCATATSKLGELAATYRDVVAANTKVLHDGRATELKAALEPHGEEFDTAARTIMQSPTMSGCAKDTAFTRALDRLLEPSP